MAWSVFDTAQGGGQPVAAGWAKAELQLASQQWGTNVDTPGNEQFLYDWQLAEGGGGKYNPLNQGPVPGHPELTTTGSQYGGGAADYASPQAGLQGALDYLDMPAYSAVKAGLIANNPTQARAALIASPWAESHYGGGAHFPSTPLPGQTAVLTDFAPGGNWDPLNWPGNAVGAVKGAPAAVAGAAGSVFSGFVKDFLTSGLVLRGTLIVVGILILLIGIRQLFDGSNSAGQTVGQGAQQVKVDVTNTAKKASKAGTNKAGNSGKSGAPAGGAEGDAADVAEAA